MNDIVWTNISFNDYIILKGSTSISKEKIELALKKTKKILQEFSLKNLFSKQFIFVFRRQKTYL